MDESSDLVTVITSRATISHTDAGLDEDTEYFYVVYTYSIEGDSSLSNRVSGRTENLPPAAVTLNPASSISESGMTLTWSKSGISDFASYKLYRSESAGVNEGDELVTEITSEETTFYDDSGLEQSKNYYYRVYVYDRSGLFSRSNEVSAKTNNLKPSPVTLIDPEVLSDRDVRLEWSKSKENDFESYRIYRGNSNLVDNTSMLIATIRDSSLSSYVDEGLGENTTYYYRVYVYDNGGLSSGSTVKGVTTLNGEPQAVSLSFADVSGVTLSWTGSQIEDFESYRIHRSESPGVDESSSLVGEIYSIAATFYRDTSVEQGKVYYYRVYVRDTGGLSKGSNEIMVTVR